MLLFLRAGRLTPSIMLCPFAALYAYQTGLTEGALWQTIVYALLLLLACLLPALPSDKCLKRLKQKLYGTPLLPERQQNILHERMGEKLFRISDVFREIQQAFTAMDEGIDEEGAQTRLFNELKERSCRLCDRAAVCEKTNVYSGFHKLIHAGCVKGKVNLIDLPSEITVNCSHPSDLIARLNASLAEYRRYMTEAENARAGRLLLAEQAQGIADVMKNAAVELSRIPADNSELTSALTKAFAKKAIACYEIGITGEENLTISAILSTDCKVTLVQDILFEVCHIPFILQEKVVYDSLKTCYIFVHPPKYDAAFGVAFATKQGESISGDTHSVVRINEHSFLATLSDGMGSGEYAQKISATAISLVEAFYRAQMPRDTVLDTINKLLSYRRDERFACLDIAAIDLNSGEAEFVKIGAPVSLIVRSGNLIVLEGEGLPLGIIESVKPTVAKQTLKGDDIVVFMSDGITSAYHSTPELCEYVQKLSPLNPQNLADQLLKEAMSRTGGVADDDMTILCVRIFEPQRAAN
jgi:stage II sporulation protein E